MLAATEPAWGTLTALVMFILASMWIGVLANRAMREGSFLKGFFLGNRGLGSWALALTATVQSGGTFMGYPSLVYSHGWSVALWIASYMVVPITGFGILGKRLAQISRRCGAITMPDLFRERFRQPVSGTGRVAVHPVLHVVHDGRAVQGRRADHEDLLGRAPATGRKTRTPGRYQITDASLARLAEQPDAALGRRLAQAACRPDLRGRDDNCPKTSKTALKKANAEPTGQADAQKILAANRRRLGADRLAVHRGADDLHRQRGRLHADRRISRRRLDRPVSKRDDVGRA